MGLFEDLSWKAQRYVKYLRTWYKYLKNSHIRIAYYSFYEERYKKIKAAYPNYQTSNWASDHLESSLKRKEKREKVIKEYETLLDEELTSDAQKKFWSDEKSKLLEAINVAVPDYMKPWLKKRINRLDKKEKKMTKRIKKWKGWLKYYQEKGWGEWFTKRISDYITKLVDDLLFVQYDTKIHWTEYGKYETQQNIEHFKVVKKIQKFTEEDIENEIQEQVEANGKKRLLL